MKVEPVGINTVNQYNYNSYLLRRNSYLFQNNNINNISSANNKIYDVSEDKISAYNNIYKNNSLYNKPPEKINRPVAENVQNFISQAKIGAFDLKGAIESLTGYNKNTNKFSAKNNITSFDFKKADSSDKNVLTIKSANQDTSVLSSEFNVEVKQIAVAQKNTGNSLVSNESALNTGFKMGLYSFDLNVDGKSYTVNVNVSPSDTNKDVQSKIAEAINNKNTDVRATVLYDSKTKTSELVLESKVTGTYNADSEFGNTKFTISNLSQNGLDRLGLDSVSQLAQNAIYSVNGGELNISESNEIKVSEGVTAVLKDVGTSTITVVKDRDSAIQDVRDMANALNRIIEAAKNNKNDERTSDLRKQFQKITDTHRNSLSRIGIDVAKDGSLKINEEKLQKATDDGRLERFMSIDKNRDNGFTNKLFKLADKVDKDATKFATLSTSTFVANDFNINDMLYLNPRQLSRYSSYQNTGLLLNMML